MLPGIQTLKRTADKLGCTLSALFTLVRADRRRANGIDSWTCWGCCIKGPAGARVAPQCCGGVPPVAVSRMCRTTLSRGVSVDREVATVRPSASDRPCSMFPLPLRCRRYSSRIMHADSASMEVPRVPPLLMIRQPPHRERTSLGVATWSFSAAPGASERFANREARARHAERRQEISWSDDGHEWCFSRCFDAVALFVHNRPRSGHAPQVCGGICAAGGSASTPDPGHCGVVSGIVALAKLPRRREHREVAVPPFFRLSSSAQFSVLLC